MTVMFVQPASASAYAVAAPESPPPSITVGWLVIRREGPPSQRLSAPLTSSYVWLPHTDHPMRPRL
jgi:hypothetical protein